QMAGPKAAGTADGSTQHTPNQAEMATEQAVANAVASLTPEQFMQALNLMQARHDEEQRASHAAARVTALDEGHTTPLPDTQLKALERLRAPFDADLISKRPQPWCKACNASETRNCKSHAKINCGKCGTWITEAHSDLDYVGHAGITDRLLSVDPTWDWEPLSVDANGLPFFDQFGGLWIKLTVCGMTRKGYGDAVGKKASPTAVKEAIGDAIRNAAMRFGMALDLWSKADLHKESEPEPHPAEPFLERINNGRIWSSTEWLTGVRREADEAGQLDYQVPGAAGATLGKIIDGRLEHLAESARIEAEERLNREEKRKAAAAQVAAEHGAAQRNAGAPPATPAAPPITEAEIRSVANSIWL
ncbi:hypothetical protein ABZ454_38955, partial [Streptomyces sp. NPDC005803]|uniref:hypothetical protein n=1 Tax=Streptomyces sp. NPDC005803 TaxID=3154297 RepID=UPI0033F12331